MKTAIEVLDDYGCPDVPFDENVTMYYPAIIDAMKEYAKEALRDAAEKSVLKLRKKSQYGKYRKWQKVKDEEEIDLFSYEVEYSVDKDSIINIELK